MCCCKYPAVSAFASIRVALGPGAPYWLAKAIPWYLALTSLSMLFSKQTNKSRNIGTAGFANRNGLQQPLKGTELPLCS